MDSLEELVLQGDVCGLSCDSRLDDAYIWEMGVVGARGGQEANGLHYWSEVLDVCFTNSRW